VKVSFVCPIYNKKRYIPIVLEAIKNQKGNFEREHIFIDDGSQDGSLDLVKKISKNWSNTFYIQHKNRGPAYSTQKGINKSTGDYLKLVGGDDIMSPNCTNILLDGMIKQSSVAIFSRCKLTNRLDISNLNNNKQLIGLKNINNPIEKTIISCFSGTTPNLFCNKSVKKAGGCYDNLFVEDFSLVLKLSKFGQFSFINNITSIGPKDDPDRIMVGNEYQVIHDYNASIFYFIKENPLLSKTIIDKACIKCIGRTEKWLRRKKGYSFFNKMRLLRLLFFFNKKEALSLIKKSCTVFYDIELPKKIRYTIN
tara:strand:+ start:1106 stop:2032 length:927 start_codon:yes stop_codon:yes gene_type:complete